MAPKWGSGSNASGYQAHFGCTVLPKWPLWAHLFYSVFYSVSELRKACFRQARAAQAVLPPGAFFRAGAFALPPCAPKSHMWRLPYWGVSEMASLGHPLLRILCQEMRHIRGFQRFSEVSEIFRIRFLILNV